MPASQTKSTPYERNRRGPAGEPGPGGRSLIAANVQVRTLHKPYFEATDLWSVSNFGPSIHSTLKEVLWKKRSPKCRQAPLYSGVKKKDFLRNNCWQALVSWNVVHLLWPIPRSVAAFYLTWHGNRVFGLRYWLIEEVGKGWFSLQFICGGVAMGDFKMK